MSSAATNKLSNPPTFVEYQGMRFLIMDAPTESSLPLYLKEMETHNVSDLVRVCDLTYPEEPIRKKNIQIHNCTFPDGDAPPPSIIGQWLDLITKRFEDPALKSPTIATHCVAGLGRAPVLVAVALIEAGMNPLDAVSFLRQKRRGVLNNKQVRWLEHYKPRKKSKCVMC